MSMEPALPPIARRSSARPPTEIADGRLWHRMAPRTWWAGRCRFGSCGWSERRNGDCARTRTRTAAPSRTPFLLLGGRGLTPSLLTAWPACCRGVHLTRAAARALRRAARGGWPCSANPRRLVLHGVARPWVSRARGCGRDPCAIGQPVSPRPGRRTAAPDPARRSRCGVQSRGEPRPARGAVGCRGAVDICAHRGCRT
jgi:hypothetical protein